MTDREITYIGMDLGTFKTSVSCSNGKRDVVLSAVGWPKDHIARGMLGRDVIFGEEIFEQRLALNVVRPFAKGVLKYLGKEAAGMPGADLERHKEAARLLVAHAVSLVDAPAGCPVYGVIGVPSRASVANKQAVLEAAKDSFDAVIIAPEPFTVAFGMNCLTQTVVIDIGAGTTDICPMCGSFPSDEDQVTLPIGGDVVDERFLALVRELYPDAKLSERRAREIKEKYGFVHNMNEKVLVTLPSNGEPKQYDVTKPLKEACSSIAGPIIEGLKQIVARFDPDFQDSFLQNILLSGGGSQMRGLDRLLEESLKQYGGGNVRKVYDCVFAGAVGALRLAMAMPEEHWSQIRTLESAGKETLCRAA
ncbi:MAG: rod shape-determining protein [Pirellulales bacterium]|nr:rod shape-determining protein [Pirellulales bacterium]